MEQTSYSKISAEGNARQQNGHIYNNTGGHSASGEARQYIGNVTNNTSYSYTLRKRRSDDTLRENERSQILLIAAAEGQRPRLNYLLTRGVNLDWSDNQGFTGLHHASLSGFEDVVQILLEAGADVNAQSLDFGTPLCLAALRGRENVVKLLLDYRANLSKAGLWVGTPLHCACFVGSVEVASILLENGASLRITSTIQERFLEYGCALNSTKTYPRLLNADGKQQGLVMCDAFYLAVSQEHDALVAYLLKANQNVDSPHWTWDTSNPVVETFEDVSEFSRTSGITALMDASLLGRSRMVSILISHGANVDLKDSDGACALSYAAAAKSNDCFECVRLLLEAGADVNSHDKDLRTPLFHATGPSRTDISRLLLNNGAEINASDMDGVTPCHRCVLRGDVRKLRVLLHQKPDLSKRDKYGHTALYKAVFNGRLDIIQRLLKAGSNPAEQTDEKWTPLHLAVYQHKTDIVKLLLDAGAPTTIEDDYGKMAADYCGASNEILNLLKAASTSRSAPSCATNKQNDLEVEATRGAIPKEQDRKAFNNMLEQYNQLQQQTILENIEMQRAQAFYNPLESMSKRDATSRAKDFNISAHGKSLEK